MTKKSKHNIKRGEIRKVGKELTAKLKQIGILPKEIIFFGSRVKQKGHKDSDLDIMVIPKTKTWNSPQEYTNLMNNVLKHTDNIKYKGNKIDLQIVSQFNPAETGFCWNSLKQNKIQKKCSQ